MSQSSEYHDEGGTCEGCKNCCCWPVWKSTFGGNKNLEDDAVPPMECDCWWWYRGHGHCCRCHYQSKALIVIGHPLSAIVDGALARLKQTTLANQDFSEVVDPPWIPPKVNVFNCCLLPNFPHLVLLSGWGRKKEVGIPWVWINPRTRCRCCCCCEWSLGRLYRCWELNEKKMLQHCSAKPGLRTPKS